MSAGVIDLIPALPCLHDLQALLLGAMKVASPVFAQGGRPLVIPQPSNLQGLLLDGLRLDRFAGRKLETWCG